jgi:hypothetical membrane protein
MFEGHRGRPYFEILAGLVGMIVFAVFWSAAIAVDGHWVFGVNTLSDLGGDRPGRLLFNSGVIITGIMLAVYSFGLNHVLVKSQMSSGGCLLMFLSSLALIGIGIFPETSGEIHLYFSWAFFILAMIGLLVLVGPAFRSAALGRISRAMTPIAPLGSIITLAIVMSIPFAEAISVILLMIWGAMTSISALLSVGAGVNRGL